MDEYDKLVFEIEEDLAHLCPCGHGLPLHIENKEEGWCPYCRERCYTIGPSCCDGEDCDCVIGVVGDVDD